MIKDLIIISSTMLIFDIFYLNLIKDIFNNQIKIIQNKPLKLNYFYAFLCYLLMALSLTYIYKYKNINLIESFFLGILVYGVFEFTSASIFTNWKIKTIILDTLWGGTLFLLILFFYKNILKLI